MVPGILGGLGQLVDGYLWRRQVGISKPHIDDVSTLMACSVSKRIDRCENVGR